MPRSKTLTDKEAKYADERAKGKCPHAAAKKAYDPVTAKTRSHKIEAREIVQLGIAQRLKEVQTELIRAGAGSREFARSVARGLRKANPSTQRLWTEIFQVSGEDALRTFVSQLVGIIAARGKQYVPPDQLSAFLRAVGNDLSTIPGLEWRHEPNQPD